MKYTIKNLEKWSLEELGQEYGAIVVRQETGLDGLGEVVDRFQAGDREVMAFIENKFYEADDSSLTDYIETRWYYIEDVTGKTQKELVADARKRGD